MNTTLSNREPVEGGERRDDAAGQNASEKEAAVGAAEKLRDIAERIERFMAQQIGRLETEIQRSSATGQSGFGGQDGDAELESQRTKWEKERDTEIRRLREEGQLLNEAWERFEAEQRRLLADRGTLQVSGGTQMQPARKIAVPQATNSAAAPTETNQNADRKSSTPTTSREQAVRQFQHLKREIGKHNRGNR